MKVQKEEYEGHILWEFLCQGCNCLHAFYTTHPKGPALEWQFNGDIESPTFQPSLLLRRPGMVCHLFVKDGKIEYLSDCTHELKNQTIPMVDL